MGYREKIMDMESWLRSQTYEIVEEPYIDASIPIPYLDNKIPAFLYTIYSDYNYAFVPMSYKDYGILEDMGYTPIKLGYENSNGPVLSASGDLRIYLILKKDSNVDVSYHYFLIKLKEYLDVYFDDVSISNNDILIDNKKVVGGAMVEYKGMIIFVFQINFVNKKNDILKICNYLKKEPGYIDSIILNPEQVKNEFLSWLV